MTTCCSLWRKWHVTQVKIEDICVWYAFTYEGMVLLREETDPSNRTQDINFYPFQVNHCGEKVLVFGMACNRRFYKGQFTYCVALAGYEIRFNLVVGSCFQRLLVTSPSSALPYTTMAVYWILKPPGEEKPYYILSYWQLCGLPKSS